MTADIGNDAESSKKRGRIPQSAWPHILERYRSGITLSAIAREYECTPSAISYIIRKAEAAGDGDEAAPAEAAPEAAVPAPVAAPAPAQAAPAQPAPAAEAPAPVQQTLRLNPQPREPEPAPVPPPVAAPPVPPAAAPASAAGGRQEPTPPLDAVEARLRETARGCLSAYRGWRQAPGETSIQALSDAVHELRKALARVEIDMSASRRDEQAIRPIPIPAHRAARRPQ